MNYIISDIHGEYDLFIELLNKINFNKNDKMIICGDIIDKGNNSIKLLKYIRKQSNMFFIIGNHEYEFLKYYNRLMLEVEDGFDYNKLLTKINDYFPDKELLDFDDLNWLEECPYFYEADDYICVHAGVMLNDKNEVINLEDNDINILLNDRKFKEPIVMVENSKCVFYGHTPTSYLTNESKIITYKKGSKYKSIKDYYKIYLDCGVFLSGVLGCFCIDTCESIYVKK